MRIDILTLFPEMFLPLNTSIIGRAQENGLLEINYINYRDYSKDRLKHVDDTPYRWRGWHDNKATANIWCI